MSIGPQEENIIATIFGMLLAYSWQAEVTESNSYSEIALCD
jgi:hypothetical protein